MMKDDMESFGGERRRQKRDLKEGRDRTRVCSTPCSEMVRSCARGNVRKKIFFFFCVHH